MAERNTALVTGSARRLGLALARDLAAAGFGVVVHSRSREAAAAAVQEVGDGCLGWVSGDLAKPSGPAEVMGETLKLTAGHLSLLVNSAGTFTPRPALRTSTEDFDLELALSARAPYYTTLAALPVLKATRGLVVNVSDYSAVDAWPAFSAHSVGKAALEMVTRVQAREFEGQVRINAICPPTVRFANDIRGADDVVPTTGDSRGSVPSSSITSAMLELYMGDATGRIVRLGGD